MSATTTVKEPAVTTAAEDKNWSGKSYPRKEDGRLVQGQGAFVDDPSMPVGGAYELCVTLSVHA